MPPCFRRARNRGGPRWDPGLARAAGRWHHRVRRRLHGRRRRGRRPLPGASGLEWNVDRPGSDYRSFDLSTPSPEMCQSACMNEPQCVAFTYVNPGVQGPNARCWLKNMVPQPVPQTCCVSGTKYAGAPPPAAPPPPPPQSGWQGAPATPPPPPAGRARRHAGRRTAAARRRRRRRAGRARRRRRPRRRRRRLVRLAGHADDAPAGARAPASGSRRPIVPARTTAASICGRRAPSCAATPAGAMRSAEPSRTCGPACRGRTRVAR